ncbi:MAG: radical SAM protein [Chloroflexi bacterium]|nr:radical SAM protein [Chloroflexota bacterium]
MTNGDPVHQQVPPRRSRTIGIRGRIADLISRRRYHLPLGYSLPPTFVFLHMTWKCNLRCKMCPYWGDIGARKDMSAQQLRHEFTRDELLNIVKQLATFRPTVCLYGGEPLLHQDVPDVLAVLAERSVPTQIITNGVFLEKHAEAIVQNRVEQVGLSIDGPGVVHDEIRGVPGTFKRLQAGVRLIGEIKRQSGSSAPRLVVNLTLHDLNVGRLEEMVEVASDLEVDKLRINHQWFTTEESYLEHLEFSRRVLGSECTTWQSYVRQLPVVNLDGFQETMTRLRKSAGQNGIELVEFPRFDPEELHDFYSQREFRPRSQRHRCSEPWYKGVIMPDGAVWMCLDLSYELGNVLETPFLDVWNSAKARYYRSQLHDLGPFPVCWRCCGLYRSLPT